MHYPRAEPSENAQRQPSGKELKDEDQWGVDRENEAIDVLEGSTKLEERVKQKRRPDVEMTGPTSTTPKPQPEKGKK
jgi:hypothetical protein